MPAQGEWPKVVRDALLAMLVATSLGAGTALWGAWNTLTRIEILVEQNVDAKGLHAARIWELEKGYWTLSGHDHDD